MPAGSGRRAAAGSTSTTAENERGVPRRREMTSAGPDGMREFIDRLRLHRTLGPDIVQVTTLPSEPATFAPFEQPLPPPLDGALRALGIDRPYAHQAEAIDRVRRGEDVLTVTP